MIQWYSYDTDALTNSLMLKCFCKQHIYRYIRIASDTSIIIAIIVAYKYYSMKPTLYRLYILSNIYIYIYIYKYIIL